MFNYDSCHSYQYFAHSVSEWSFVLLYIRLFFKLGVTCQILFQKPKEGVFRAGQPVVGTLKYEVDKPTKFTSVEICLNGKGKCRWSDTDSDYNTSYYSNKEEYVNIRKKLLTGHNVLSETYEHPFKFILPENIPTSIKNKNCTIEYKVLVTLFKDDFFVTKYEFDAEVVVYSYVSPCSPEPLIFGLQKNLISLTSNNKIEVKAVIEKTCVTPGENIHLQLTIHNDTDVPITIKTELMKYFTYVSEFQFKYIDKKAVEYSARYSPSVQERTVLKMKCIVPTLPSLYSIQHTYILMGEYKVRVTAELPFPHIDAMVEVPVVIGESRSHVGAAVLGYENISLSKVPQREEKYEIGETAEEFFSKYDRNMKDIVKRCHLVDTYFGGKVEYFPKLS